MAKKLRQSELRHILVRSTNWIGDAIMTLPAVRTIRENFPGARISLLALPWVADIFRSSPHVDAIVVYDKNGSHRGMSGRLRLIGELRAGGYDAAILLQNAFEAALVTALAGIPVRAGYATDGRRLLLTHPVALPAERKKIHQVHYYQGLLQDLGLAPGADELSLSLPQDAMKWAEDFLPQHGALDADAPRTLVGFNPGAAYGPAKRWPGEYFAALAALLSQRRRVRIAVFGTDKDTAVAAEIKQAAPDAVVDVTGRTTLAQAMALIGRCAVFVTNDSGLMHVAAALGTPTVAIFGSTNPVTTGPYSARSHVIRKEMDCSPCLKTECRADFRCMRDISSVEVCDAVETMLQQLSQR